MIASSDERLRCPEGRLRCWKELIDERFEWTGNIIGDAGSSVPGVVGREESRPASLKTVSKMDDERLVEPGEPGPEKFRIGW
jgi:hypothetical protein